MRRIQLAMAAFALACAGSRMEVGKLHLDSVPRIPAGGGLAVCEGVIDTVCLPVDWPLAESRKDD